MFLFQYKIVSNIKFQNWQKTYYTYKLRKNLYIFLTLLKCSTILIFVLFSYMIKNIQMLEKSYIFLNKLCYKILKLKVLESSISIHRQCINSVKWLFLFSCLLMTNLSDLPMLHCSNSAYLIDVRGLSGESLIAIKLPMLTPNA